MSYSPASPYESMEMLDNAGAAAAEQHMLYIPRSPFLPLPFVLPVLVCGISWMCNGVQILTDIGFSILTLLCIALTLNELIKFPRRFGLGGLTLFGGVLVWFSHDYFSNWFNFDFANHPGFSFDTAVLAKAAFYYSLFTMLMVVGLNIQRGQWLERLLLKVPEAQPAELYLILIAVMQVVGFSAFLFTSDNFFVSVAKGALSPWLGPANFTVGRTGAYNYNWGGYVAQLIEVGQVGSLLALAYAILTARRPVTKIVCWALWLYWALWAYSTGRRGGIAYVGLPALSLLFIKYQARAAMRARRHSIIAYVVTILGGFALLLVVQVQGTFRDLGLGQEVDLSQVQLTKNQGNSMFTEGLLGFQMVPDQEPFFCNHFYGEGLIRALPETAYWFVIGPIPRALWTSKPADPAMIWYNQVAGGTNGVEGTTSSQGIVGHWYVRYGFFGVVQGALLLGWLMGVFERLLLHGQGQMISILLSVALLAWIFRVYRNFYFPELYSLMVGVLAYVILLTALRPFLGGVAASGQSSAG